MPARELLRVHERVSKRHPEIDDRDVAQAWNFPLASAVRHGGAFDDCVVVGADGCGRLIEMIAVREEGGWLVCHANTPPTKRVLSELGLRGGGRRGA